MPLLGRRLRRGALRWLGPRLLLRRIEHLSRVDVADGVLDLTNPRAEPACHLRHALRAEEQRDDPDEDDDLPDPETQWHATIVA